MKLKLTKTDAIKFFKSVMSIGSGTFVVTPNIRYGIRLGQLIYTVEPVDNWPDGIVLGMSIFIGDKLISATFFNPETFELDWKTTERERRKRENR